MNFILQSLLRAAYCRSLFRIYAVLCFSNATYATVKILHKIPAGGILAIKGACAQLAAVYEHDVAARGVRFGVG